MTTYADWLRDTKQLARDRLRGINPDIMAPSYDFARDWRAGKTPAQAAQRALISWSGGNPDR